MIDSVEVGSEENHTGRPFTDTDNQQPTPDNDTRKQWNNKTTDKDTRQSTVSTRQRHPKQLKNKNHLQRHLTINSQYRYMTTESRQPVTNNSRMVRRYTRQTKQTTDNRKWEISQILTEIRENRQDIYYLAKNFPKITLLFLFLWKINSYNLPFIEV